MLSIHILIDNYRERSQTLPTFRQWRTGDTGIMLNEIYTYMEVTLPSSKSVEAKKKTLSYLLQRLKESGIVYPEGLRWKATNS